jgi:cell division protein FtsI (penicillin-binding protein 3)
MEKHNKIRLAIFLGLISIWAVLIFGRLFYVQVVQCDHYRKEAAEQQEKFLDLAPRRGFIFDRNWEKLAVSIETDSLNVDPQMIKNPTDTLAKFAHILSMNGYDLCKDFNNRKTRKKRFFFIKRKLNPQEKKEILELDIEGLEFCKGKSRKDCELEGHLIKHFNTAGIYFQKEYKRYYPKGSLASHILGICDLDETGIEGIEKKYNELLREDPPSIQVFKDAKGNMFPLERPGYRKKDHHLVLTIDAYLQHFAERELEKAVHAFRAYKGCVIMMDPKSGEILALAARPTFNPNQHQCFPEENRKVFPITDFYEPGSTFKVIALASLIENGHFHPREIIDCGKGCIYVHGIRISDHHPYDKLTASEVFEKSSNVGVIRLSERLSEESLYDTIKNFGFKEKTGIDLPGVRISPYVSDPSRWSGISKAVLSIGHEIAIPPIQMLTAYAAVANEGIMIQPHVAKGHLDPFGDFISYEGFSQKQLISAKTAKKINNVLERVVLFGTGQNAQIPGYSIAGKTGTAQVFDKKQNKFSDTHLVASFIGYAPSDDPRIVCLVLLDIPKGKKFYGGDVAAPVFSKIVEQTLLYFKIPPNHRMFPTEQLNETYNQNSNKAASPSSPLQKVSLIKDQRILLAQSTSSQPPRKGKKQIHDSESDQMPDLLGKSLRDAMLSLSSKGCRFRASGNGYVVRQYPEAGMTLCQNDICILELSNDSYELEQALQREGSTH